MSFSIFGKIKKRIIRSLIKNVSNDYYICYTFVIYVSFDLCRVWIIFIRKITSISIDTVSKKIKWNKYINFYNYIVAKYQSIKVCTCTVALPCFSPLYLLRILSLEDPCWTSWASSTYSLNNIATCSALITIFTTWPAPEI